MTQPHDVVHASKRYQEWLSVLKDEASLVTHNQSQAMMRAVMHELRRSLDPECILVVANALPALPRGIFLEGWSLREKAVPPQSDEEFHGRVYLRLAAHHSPPPTIVRDVFAVWSRFLEPAAARTIRGCLPEALRSLWPSEAGGFADRKTAPAR